MLKFNIKEHKPEELEKYGFEDYPYLWEFYYGGDKITVQDNKIFVCVYNVIASDKLLNILYELIKSGLIIKE